MAVLVLVFLLLLNAVFAMSELAMMTSRHGVLERSASRGKKGAVVALQLAQNPTRFLSTVQVGITLVGVLAGAYGEKALSTTVQGWIAQIPALAPHADVIALLLVVLTITYFTLVFAELVPKRLALAYPETIAMLIAPPLSAISKIAAVPVWVLSVSTNAVAKALRIKDRDGSEVSEDEIRSLMSKAAITGVFDPSEHELFERAMRLSDTRTESLMVPRSDIVWLDMNASPEIVRTTVGTNPYSHFPVGNGALDEFRGVVHIKDLIAHGLIAGDSFRIADIAATPFYVPKSMPAFKLLRKLREARSHVAMVVDEYGLIVGMVTLNDITEALLGASSRGSEVEETLATRRDDGTWLIDGGMAISEFLETIDAPDRLLDDLPRVATVAGLVLHELTHIPSVGEWFVWRTVRFEVVDLDGHRIDKLLVSFPDWDAREEEEDEE